MKNPFNVSIPLESLTGDFSNRGVITWQDDKGRGLYYALISSTGTVLTPPMAFLHGTAPVAPNLKSSSGHGAAPLYWGNFLPTVLK